MNNTQQNTANGYTSFPPFEENRQARSPPQDVLPKYTEHDPNHAQQSTAAEGVVSRDFGTFTSSGKRVDSVQPPSQAAQYVEVRFISGSGEGNVSLVRHRQSGVFRIHKVLHFEEDGMGRTADYAREARTLKTLNSAYAHPNVIQMVFEDQLLDGHRLLCLEYCSGGDVSDQLFRFLQRGMRTPALFVLQCAIGVGEALAFIHHGLVRSNTAGRYRKVKGVPETGISHLDLKPENIFLRHPLDEYGLPQAVLSDFGHASTEPRFPCGTEGFHSPELLDSKIGPVTSKTDVYSFGITMHEICVGLDGNKWAVSRNPAELSLRQELKDLSVEIFLRRCLAVNPKERIAMDVEGGLTYVAGFRGLRATLAREQPIDRRVWSDAPKQLVSER